MEIEYNYQASVLKRVEIGDTVNIQESGHKPQTGDVIAVRIEEKRGNYGDLDLPGGKLVELEPGDVVLGTFGNRAGVKGYIGCVPERVEKGSQVDFIGSGGLFGKYISATKELGLPYRGEFLGYVSKDGKILNTEEHGIERINDLEADARVLAVAATRMDSGKTTLASKLIEELDGRNYDVGSVKLTGSARERDRLKMLESGSKISLDFVDAGLPSTVEDSEKVIESAKGLIKHAWTEEDLDLIVAELGAGLISKYRVENVLQDLDIKDTVFSVAVTALDVAGAYGIKETLQNMEYRPDLVAGPITDTTAGKEKVEDKVSAPALNAFNKEDIEEATDIVEDNLKN